MKFFLVIVLALTFTSVASAKKFVVVKGAGGSGSCPQGSVGSTGCENPGPTQNGALCCDDGAKKFLYLDPRFNKAIPVQTKQ